MHQKKKKKKWKLAITDFFNQLSHLKTAVFCNVIIACSVAFVRLFARSVFQVKTKGLVTIESRTQSARAILTGTRLV